VSQGSVQGRQLSVDDLLTDAVGIALATLLTLSETVRNGITSFAAHNETKMAELSGNIPNPFVCPWPFIFPGGGMFPDTFSFLGNYSVMMPDASTHSLCQDSIVSFDTGRKVLFQHRRIRRNQAPFKLTALYPVRGEHSTAGVESTELTRDNAVPQPLGCAKPETSL